MRARRAERCLQRATAAIENGAVVDARDALDEARHLTLSDPRVADLEVRLTTLTASELPASTAAGLDVIAPVTLETVSEPAIVDEPVGAEEIDIDFHPTTYSDPVMVPEIIEAPSTWQIPEVADISAGAFEPVLDVDRMRTPFVATWSGVTLGAPSRDRSRAAGVLAFGLLLSAFAGWQAWEHKDQWNSFLPSAQPDVDATTGLAANASRPEPVAAAIVQEPSGNATVPTAQSDPEPVASEPAQHEDALPDSALRASGTSGDTALPAVRPSAPSQSAELTAAAARREPEVSTGATTGVPPRQPDSPPVAPPIENRTTAPLTSTATPPAATAPAPAIVAPPPLPAPSAPPPSASAAGTQPNPGVTRTEPAPPLPSSTPPAPAAAASSTTSPTASPNASLNTSPSTSAAPSSAVRDESAAVRAALARYETAYSKLDVAAVQSVWPSLDQRALSRAFDGLAAQRLSLGNCSVNVKGSAARADCSGTAAWTPKIGGGERKASRKWTFDLNESDGTWRIVRVEAR